MPAIVLSFAVLVLGLAPHLLVGLSEAATTGLSQLATTSITGAFA
jgi:NAD(P)H-quinone oxidoreductase subunit 4